MFGPGDPPAPITVPLLDMDPAAVLLEPAPSLDEAPPPELPPPLLCACTRSEERYRERCGFMVRGNTEGAVPILDLT